MTLIWSCMHAHTFTTLFSWTRNGKAIPHLAPEYPEIHQMQHVHTWCLLLEK